eukprot:444987-Rhodomonas_salina.1
MPRSAGGPPGRAPSSGSRRRRLRVRLTRTRTRLVIWCLGYPRAGPLMPVCHMWCYPGQPRAEVTVHPQPHFHPAAPVRATSPLAIEGLGDQGSLGRWGLEIEGGGTKREREASVCHNK